MEGPDSAWNKKSIKSEKLTKPGVHPGLEIPPRCLKALIFAAFLGGVSRPFGCFSEGPNSTGTSTGYDLDRYVIDSKNRTTGGPGTMENPYDPIQSRLNNANPGDDVHVFPGEYRNQISTSHCG